MREVWATTQFKKDFKRFKNNKAFVGKLMALVKLLADDQPIPPAYGPSAFDGQLEELYGMPYRERLPADMV